jgi:hypothetical protein
VRKEVEWGKAFDGAVDWLVRHQDDDGHWSAAEFMKHDPKGKQEPGAGNPGVDIGTTGLALLALTADGSSLEQGKYRQPITKACEWIVNQQDKTNGLFGYPSCQEYFYCHCSALWGFAEAMNGCHDEGRSRVMLLAASRVNGHRNPNGAWRYAPAGGDADSSMTSWAVHALLAVRAVGGDIPDAPLKAGVDWLQSATDAQSGQVGYTQIGEGSSRALEVLQAWPHSATEVLTAESLSVRMAMGMELLKNKKPVPGLALVQGMLPTADSRKVDALYWWFGAEVVLPHGGDSAKAWLKGIKDGIVKTQLTAKAGTAAGSWDLDDPWLHEGGRVYLTSVLALALASPWRLAH